MTAVTKRRPARDTTDNEITDKMKPAPGRRPGEQPERAPNEPEADVQRQREEAPAERKGHGIDRDLDDRPAQDFPLDGQIDEFVEQNEKKAPPPPDAPPLQAPPAERPANER